MPLDGLRGHREIGARLLAEIHRRPAHAYLFTGPRGVGKALLAHALAHSMLCERSPGADFCCTPERCAVRAGASPRGGRGHNRGEAPGCECCPGCVQVAAGVHPDFTSVTRSAGRTDVLIEQVRALIAQLAIRPARAPARVAILDDAETLNLPAQNALLKTLEEPPGRAIVFMVSASERALLDTVRSRLRLVRFGPLAAAQVEALLLRAGIEAARAGALARLSRGSAGRALAMAGGDEPPLKPLLTALASAKRLDFAGAQALAQELFSNRDQAADNFELIARLLEEILCHKLLGEAFCAPAPEPARLMSDLAANLSAAAIVELLDGALCARAAIDAMANSRLRAEQWWMDAGRALGRK